MRGSTRALARSLLLRCNKKVNVTNELTKLTEAIARTTGRRYCSTHRSEVPVEAGSYVQCNKTTRWVCFACQKRRDVAGAARINAP